MQTLAADLGIPEDAARAMDPTIPTIAPALDAALALQLTLGIVSE